MNHLTTQRITIACFAAVLLSTTVAAQAQVQIRIAGGAGNGFGTQVHATLDPEQMDLFLQMRIEQMQAVCGLDQSQMNKLALAGKSAARKLFPNSKAMQIGGVGFNKQLEVQLDSLSDEDTEKDTEEDTAAEQVELPFLKIPISLREVVERPLWKKAIKKVLTEQQQQEWNAYQAKQTEKMRKLVVRHRVAELEKQLCLMPDQLEEVAQIVDRVEGDQLVENFNSAVPQILKVGDRTNAKTLAENLKDVLTETQITVWASRGGMTSMMENLLGVAPANPNSQPTEIDAEILDDLTVKSVKKGSNAEALGLKEGDVIDSINGEPVDTKLQLRAAIRDANKIKSMDVVRDGEFMHLENQ